MLRSQGQEVLAASLPTAIPGARLNSGAGMATLSMTRSAAKPYPGEFWAPALFLTITIALVYAFAVITRFRIGSWPDSAIDWLAFDDGAHEGLLAFGEIAFAAIGIALLTVVLWTLALLGMALAGHQAFPLKPVLVTWSVAGLFLLAGGAKLVFWYLD